MRSSKVPVAVKNKTVSEATMIHKKSPLDEIREKFEKKRSEERRNIRASTFAQIELRRQKLWCNGDNGVGVGDHNAYVERQINQRHHPFPNGLDRIQKNQSFNVESQTALCKLVQIEKKSAGRDRSHPLQPIVGVQTSRRQSSDETVVTEKNVKKGGSLSDTVLNSTYTVKKTTMLPSREQTNCEQGDATVLPLVKGPNVHRLVDASQLEKNCNDTSHNTEVPLSCCSNETSSDGNAFTKNTKQFSGGDSSAMFSDEPNTNGRICYTTTPCSNANNVKLHSGPLAALLADESSSIYVEELRKLRKAKLRQTELQRMNSRIVAKRGCPDDYIYSNTEARENKLEQLNIERQHSGLRQNSRQPQVKTKTVPSDPRKIGGREPTSLYSHRNDHDTVSDSRSGFHGNGDGLASHSPIHRSDSQFEINDGGRSIDPVQPQQVVVSNTDSSEGSKGQYDLKKLDEPDAAPSGDMELIKCNLCYRSFLRDRLAKHQEICMKKAAAPKRVAFDPTKMRVQGTEFAPYVYTKKKREIPVCRKGSDWRHKHNMLCQQMQYARKVDAVVKRGGKLCDMPEPPPTMINPDHVQCPTCDRRFNPGSAEKHIPWCKESRQRQAALTNSRRKKT